MVDACARIRTGFRALARAGAGGLLVLGIVLPALAAIQATPGKDGAGGTLNGVDNDYWPGTGSPSVGSTSISVGTRRVGGGGQTITAGDLLLVMQMQGADINSTNTGAYGDGVAGEPGAGALASNFQAGTFEYVVAQNTVGAGGGSITIVGGNGGGLLNSYFTAAAGAQGRRTFQVIRVPQYTSATLSSALTALPWNGTSGGVLAIDVQNTLTLGGNVDVSGLGFRGAGSQQKGTISGNTILEYRTLSSLDRNAGKGEGTAGTPRFVYTAATGVQNTGVEGYPDGSFGVGAPGNAGGGGTDRTGQNHNSGGGGGGNAGAGGRGGIAWNPNGPGSDLGGFGGAALPIDGSRVFMGGGGGAGSRNNGNAGDSHGGTGGGIVMIRTGSVTGSGTITADGGRGIDAANDGSGGGGSGGSVQMIVYDETPLSGLTVQASGGDGGDAWPTQSGGNVNAAHGAGGGGGGGAVTSNVAIGSVNNPGGADGTSLQTQIDTGSDPGQTNNGNSGGSVPIDPEDVPGTTGGGNPARSDLAITKSHSGNFDTGTLGNYTISVANNGPDAETGLITVTDVLPAGLSYSQAAGGGWTCSEASGTVTCTRTGLAASATAPDITLTVSVGVAAAPSTTNTASVSGANVDDVPGNNSDSDPTTVTNTSPPVADGVKPLYFNTDDEDNGPGGGGSDDPISVQRVAPVIPSNDRDQHYVQLYNTSADGPTSAEWELLTDAGSPPVVAGVVSDLVFDGARASTAVIYITEEDGGNERSVLVELLKNDTVFASAAVAEQPLSSDNGNPTAVPFTFGLTSETISPGDSLKVRVTHTTGPAGTPNCDDCDDDLRIRVWMQSEDFGTSTSYTNRSRLLLATNVINVDSVAAYDDSFANGGGSIWNVVSPGDPTFLRAEVSDPFGTFDIRTAVITVTEPGGGATTITGATMTLVEDNGATKIFETPFTPNDPPPNPLGPVGDWNILVRADEGVVAEWGGNPIFHERTGSFELGLPDFLIMKSSPAVFSDPVNLVGLNDPDDSDDDGDFGPNGNNPKRIPGAVVVYNVQVSNMGRGRADAETITVTDNLPASTRLWHATPTADDEDPFAFSAGTSDLTYSYPGDVSFVFDDGGTTPQDTDDDGCYDNVTGFAVTPSGRMAADAPPLTSAPSFRISYRACIN